MRPERFRRIDELFHSALQVDVAHRARFLQRTCSGDRELRLHVQRLLNCHREADSFLETPAVEVLTEAGRTARKDPVADGEIVSHYRVGARLGSGGMGVVYVGEDLKLGRGVALKFLFEDLTQYTHSTSGLLEEARAASSLNHPNICTIYSIEEHRGRPVMVMELLEGENLRERLNSGKFQIEEIVRLGLEACDALRAAHEKGIVHRDIKPANIFLTPDGHGKLLDFGIARWMQQGQVEANRSQIAGTVLYMSPEQSRGDKIDGRSDLFSLGVVLYEMATGVHPFDRGNPLLTIEAVRHEAVRMPSTLNPALPVAFDRVIEQMLEKDREQRYGSAVEASNDLTQLRLPRPQRRRLWRFAAIGAAAAALVCGLSILLRPVHRAPVLTDKDTIVVADFENRTGEPIFNETLRPGLFVELQQSPYLSLISEQHIQQVLRSMARPPDAPLSGKTAREVCARTSSAAVVDGSIGNLGNEYLLLLRATDCRTGELLYTQQAQAKRKEDVLRALSWIARGFRERAGESRVTLAKYSKPLAEATTPSFEAWQLFSEGMRVGMLEGHAAAIPFLRRAIEIDPEFATAEAMLGRDYSALGEMELARDYTRRAFERRARASEQERFFIDFSYDRLVTGNLEKAMETCELWTHAYPRDALGHGLYGATAKVLGRFDKTVEENRKAIAVDPDLPYSYVHLSSVAIYRNDLAEAQRWLDRATERKLMLPDFLMMRHYIAFFRNDSAEMQRVGAAAEGMSEIQDWIWGERAGVFAFSGHYKEARAMSGRALAVALQADRRESAAQHEAAWAVREALAGNDQEARTRAIAAQKLSHGRDAAYGAALAFSLAGDTARALAVTNTLEQQYREDTLVRFNILPTLRAAIAIRLGKAAEAAEVLTAAERYAYGWLGCCSVGFVGTLYPMYVHGEAYLALQQGAEAAAEFQKIIDHRGMLGADPMVALTHWRRGKALAVAGRNTEAKAEYQEFLSRWREADADIPVLARIKGEYEKLSNFD